jgi:hypothetical protein
LLRGKNEDMKVFLEKDLRAGDFSNLNAECLTDIWIGKGRWAFIDLTAGPFSWGPSVGGEGVRTELSLPNVGTTIGAVAEISEDEAEDKLQTAIQDKFSVFGENDHQAVDILLAEIDVYELFAFKHCKGRKVKLALCEGAYINAALFSCTLFVNSFSLVSKKDSVQLPRHFLELLFRDFVCLSSFCLRFTCPRT